MTRRPDPADAGRRAADPYAAGDEDLRSLARSGWGWLAALLLLACTAITGIVIIIRAIAAAL